VLNEVDELWGRVTLLSNPERIVSSPAPHLLLSETFGEALKFWDSMVWYNCISETSIDRVEAKCKPLLDSLDGKFPVDRASLFSDTRAAQRKRGFVLMRDVLTGHRQKWADQYLAKYLESRWKQALRNATTAYSKHVVDGSSPPSLQIFATHAMEPANHWFGGDISLLYTSIGEPYPGEKTQIAERIFPRDRFGLVRLLYKLMPADTSSIRMGELIRFVFRYLQIWEQLGFEPTLKEAGARAFMAVQTVQKMGAKYLFSESADKAFEAFQALVRDALAQVDQINPASAEESRTHVLKGSPIN
jgi:hypothetical protein